MNKESLLRRLDAFPLCEASFIDPRVIEFSDEVRAMCAQNACGQFGATWRCPPAVGPLSEWRARCGAFDNALLLSTVTPLEDSLDFEGMMDAMVKHQALSLDIRDLVNAQISPEDSLLLGAGGCKICETCCYPDGLPCRFPDRSIDSMEAAGINVVALCRATGFRYHNGPNTVTFFSILFL